MKCPDCGATHNGMYKEIRQQIAEMGITKEDIKKAIDDTITSLVKSAISEKLDEHIKNAIDSYVRNKIIYSRDADKMVSEAFKAAMAEAIAEKLEVKVAFKETKEE